MKINNGLCIETWYSPKRFSTNDGHVLCFWLQISLNPYIKLLHRKDGPAVIYKKFDNKSWYRRHKGYRKDGPAVIRNNGKSSWFHCGTSSSEEQYWNT